MITLMLSEKGLNWQAFYRGFIPNINSLLYPSEEYEVLLNSIEDKYRYYWSDLIVQKQTDVLVSAAATAVGINMTFLFPYTILKRRWGRPFKGFVIFLRMCSIFEMIVGPKSKPYGSISSQPAGCGQNM